MALSARSGSSDRKRRLSRVEVSLPTRDYRRCLRAAMLTSVWTAPGRDGLAPACVRVRSHRDYVAKDAARGTAESTPSSSRRRCRLVKFIRSDAGDNRGGWIARRASDGFGEDYWFRTAQLRRHLVEQQPGGGLLRRRGGCRGRALDGATLPPALRGCRRAAGARERYWSLTLMSLPTTGWSQRAESIRVQQPVEVPVRGRRLAGSLPRGERSAQAPESTGFRRQRASHSRSPCACTYRNRGALGRVLRAAIERAPEYRTDDIQDREHNSR